MVNKINKRNLFGVSTFWQDEEGNSYSDYDIEFENILSPGEKHKILKHFLTGIEKYDATDEYVIEFVDFLEPRHLRISVQLLSPQKSTVFFGLMSELRRTWPVKQKNDVE